MKALILENLTKTYANGVQAVKGINLTIEEGEFFALLGPNGAGKSTTIGMIASLVNKTAGTITVFDHDLDREPDKVKACIGLVPQEFNCNIFETCMTILMNQAGYYGIPRKIAFERTEYFLEKLGLFEKRNDTPRMLSGGMKRRLMIARALVHHPKLLILDEPTAGVDIETRRTMWDFIREINTQGTTVILTTHYLEEAESLCEKIAIINYGHIVQDTRMDVLLRQLHRETLILDVDKPLDAAPSLKDYPLRLIDPQTLEVDVLKSQSMNTLFAELSEHGILVHSLRNKTNRLEELFIHLIEEGQL